MTGPFSSVFSAAFAKATPPSPTPTPAPAPTPTPSPTGTPSPDGTIVNYVGPTLVDATGATWGLTGTGPGAFQATVNGVADLSVTNVNFLLYYTSLVYEQRGSGDWYYKAAPGNAWSGPTSDPRSATPTPPPTFSPSPNNTIVNYVGPTLTDNTGATWALTGSGPGAFEATVNGVPDTSVTNVNFLLYYNSLVYEQRGAGDWYYTAAPGNAWTYNGGDPRSSSPTPTPSPTFTPSPSGTVVDYVGPTIVDATGETWALTGSGAGSFQATINGVADTSVGNINFLLCYNSLIYEQRAGGIWYHKAKSADAWTLDSGDPRPGTSATVSPTGTVRHWYDHPGGNNCFWNTPLGDGCIWGTSSDADTRDARHGGFINSVDNFGSTFWVSNDPNNPVTSFSGHDEDYANPAHPGTNNSYSVTCHVVPHSYTAGPYSGGAIDGQYGFCDTISQPGMYYQASPLKFQNYGVDNQGPFANGSNANDGGAIDVFHDDAMSDNFGTDYETKKGGPVQSAGTIRGYDLDPNRNPSRIPGTNLTAIQHVLRYATDVAYLKSNTDPKNPAYPNGTLLPNSWPLWYQDYQTGVNVYRGNLIYGTLLGIPKDVAMPSNLSDAGKQIWWTLQHYGSVTRDGAAGGIHFCTTQDVAQSWIDSANGDLQTIVQYLCPLRNQHIGGQPFSSSPINGPGNRLDAGPPPLAPLAGVTPSADQATVIGPNGGSITDAVGNLWTITASGQVAVNGVADTSTNSVIELAYVSSRIWHENSSHLWYYKSVPSDSWAPQNGTSTSPLTAVSPTPTPTPTSIVTRNWWDQPGGAGCVWNTPLGDGCIWGTASDADTISLRHGGFINSTNNFGAVFWVSQSASNPVATFSNSSGTSPLTVTAHCVPGSYAPGPFPGDNQYCFADTVSYPGKYFQFSPSNITSFTAGQGPFNYNDGGFEDALSDNCGEDWETGHNNAVQAIGIIRAYDLDPARNPARMPGLSGVTAIQHMLRYGTDGTFFASNVDPNNPGYLNSQLLPSSWPQKYQDPQSPSIVVYTGNLKYGTTIGIPSNVAMPSTIKTTAGKQIWWTLQHYGAVCRETAGGGMHFWADQDVAAQWISDANSDLQTIVGYLCPLRNQHQGGQSFTTNPKNGPGNRLDVGPPPLAGTVPATVTQSADRTVVLAGSGGIITDAAGNQWTITSSGQVAINGVPDTTTASVVELAYVGGLVWQENSSGLWWSKASPTAGWSPAYGTSTSPLGGGFTTTGPMLLPSGFLSTVGNQIVDKNGIAVRIASIGWNGADGKSNRPQGLEFAPLDQMMSKIVSLGFNCIRLPYNDKGFFELGTTDLTTNSNNPTLVGKTPLQVMDAMVAAAKTAGLKVIINHHTNEGGTNGFGGQQANGLWFTSGSGTDNTDGGGNQGTVTAATFQNNWVSIASRYKGNDTVIGFDLVNEPLSSASSQRTLMSWGDGGVTDIQAMYQNVGNAILAANPDGLIICEAFIDFGRFGVSYGNNLGPVQTKPVTLNNQKKLVYSVHIYPKQIGGIAYDSGPNYISDLNTQWGFIVKNNIAPVWIGEIGASLNGDGESAGAGAVASEQAWASDTVSYLNGTMTNGPTFADTEQPIGIDWWLYGDLAGQYPDGVLTGGWVGSAKPEQQQVYSQLQYTKRINPVTLPSAPVLTVGAPTTVSVSLSWTTSVGGSITYQVQYRLHGSSSWINVGSPTTALSINVTGLSASTSYDFEVSATNSAGTTTSSVVVVTTATQSIPTPNPTPTPTPSGTAPSAPIGLAASAITSTSLVFGWQPSSGSAPIVYQPQYRLHSATPTPTPTPTTTTSPNNTVVLAGSGGSIRDASGNVWTITTSGQVAINGAPDTTTSNVIELAYVNGIVWQENTSQDWYGKSSPTAQWLPTLGTKTSPLPAPTPPTPTPPSPTPTPTTTVSPNNTVVLAGSGGVITDANLNRWTITNGAQVAVNGATDTTTANVIELAYVNGQVWQENSSQLWWAKTLPTDSWSPPLGTSLSPLPTSATGAPSASAVLAYLNKIAGTHTISGQFIELKSLDPITALQQQTGKNVGMIGGDYWWYGSTDQNASYDFNPHAVEWWSGGGLVTLALSMPNPTTGQALTDLSTLDTAGLLVSGTATNNYFMNMLNTIATGLDSLQKSGVVVIFRPFHESNGTWFWWGRTFLSDTQFISAWQYMHDYFTNTKGLKNLLWLYSVNTGTGNIGARYPGASYVDIVGQDMYTSTPTNGQSDYNTLLSFGKPVCLAEFGAGDAGNGDPNFDETTLISAIKSVMPKTVLWQQWWKPWGMGDVKNATAALGDPWVLNRGDLSIFNAAPPTPTPTPSTFTPSPNNTVVMAGSGGSITDASGNVWTITTGGQVAINGVPDGTTSAVVELAYVNGVVWQENTSQDWYGKSSPTAPWSPPLGTKTSPLPPTPTPPTPVPPTPTPTPTPTPGQSPDKTVVMAGSGGSIRDASGNVWTITTGGQVAINGAADTTTSNVVELAYVGGIVWQENTSQDWYGKSSPTAPWSPATGTKVSPLTAGSLISAPLTGTVTTGTWTTQLYNNRTTYGLLAPANFDSTKQYPLILFMHQFSWGSMGFSTLQSEMDPWFNTVAFRRAYPCYVLAPMCYQGADGGDGTKNWGGVDGQDQAAQDDAIGLVKDLIAGGQIYPSKVYVTGCSMGGIGSWDDIIKFNLLTGTQDRLFAAALIMAGATYQWGGPGSANGVPPSQAVIDNLKNVPIWAIHGGQDTTVPLAWDRAMANAIGTNAGGKMVYTEDASLGHDVWDTYYSQTNVWDWTFAQALSKVPTPTPTPTPPTPTPTPTPPTPTPTPPTPTPPTPTPTPTPPTPTPPTPTPTPTPPTPVPPTPVPPTPTPTPPTPPAAAPQPVQGINRLDAHTTTMLMAWSPPINVPGPFTYNLAWKLHSDSTFGNTVTGIQNASYMVTGLSANAYVDFSIWAVDSTGQRGGASTSGPWIAPATDNPSPNEYAPYLPPLASPGQQMFNSINQSYTLTDNGNGSFQVNVNGTPDPVATKVVALYYKNHQVFRVDAGSGDVWVQTTSFGAWVQMTEVGGVPIGGIPVLGPPPGPVTNLGLAAITGNPTTTSIQWSWGKPSNGTPPYTYVLQTKLHSDANFGPLLGGYGFDQPTYIATDLTPGTNYDITVAAVDYYGQQGPLITSGPWATSTPVTSPSGTIVNYEGPTLVDATGAVWALTGPGAGSYQATVNGAADTAASDVNFLLYYNSLVYEQRNVGIWYYKANPNDAWTGASGDPRPAPPTPTPPTPTPTPTPPTPTPTPPTPTPPPPLEFYYQPPWWPYTYYVHYVGSSTHAAVYYDTALFSPGDGFTACENVLGVIENVIARTFGLFGPTYTINRSAITPYNNGTLANIVTTGNQSFWGAHTLATAAGSSDILVSIPSAYATQATYGYALACEVAENYMGGFAGIRLEDVYAIGEGMSQVVGLLFYWDAHEIVYNWPAYWLDYVNPGTGQYGTRPDFVNTNILAADATNGRIAISCNMHFINWLRRKGYSFRAILDVLAAGSSDGMSGRQIWNVLAGRTDIDPFPYFTADVSAIYPVGTYAAPATLKANSGPGGDIWKTIW